jgi:hypothetical protein
MRNLWYGIKINPLVTYHVSQGYSQLPRRLPHIVKIQHVWVVDQFHDHDFPLNAEQDLVRAGSGFRDRHPRIEYETFGNNLDGGILAGNGMFRYLDPA